MITWLISVDISLKKSPNWSVPSQGGGGICPSTEWLGIWKQWSSTIASGNSEFGQQGSQAKPKPLSNFPLLVKMFAIHDIYVYNIYDIYIYMNQYEKSRKKWNYTRIFCHWKTWIGPLFGVLNTCYCHWCILLLFWNILYFTRPRFQIKQSQWEIETCNETTHHDMVLSAVCQLGQRNLFVFSQKYILKTHKFNKHQYVNRYFGTKIIRLKSQFAIFSGMSVTLFLENKQSYTQSQSYINTPCVCCQVALHSRWDLTFKAVRNETNDRPWNIWRYDYTPHRKPQTSTTNPSSWTKQLQHTHRIRLLCLYLDEWLIFMVNEGKYNIHGCYGYRYDQHCLFPRNHVNDCFFLYQPTLDPY